MIGVAPFSLLYYYTLQKCYGIKMIYLDAVEVFCSKSQSFVPSLMETGANFLLLLTQFWKKISYFYFRGFLLVDQCNNKRVMNKCTATLPHLNKHSDEEITC